MCLFWCAHTHKKEADLQLWQNIGTSEGSGSVTAAESGPGEPALEPLG